MDQKSYAINTETLGGSLEAKLQAIADAGFTAIELAGKDLLEHPEGAEVAVRRVRDSGLKVSAFHMLRDFEGSHGTAFEYKIGVAKSVIEMAAAVRCRLLIVCSSTSPQATGEPQEVAEHLSILGRLATPLGVRIGYEALSWGRAVAEYTDAWNAVEIARRDNVGLVLDAFHILARGTRLDRIADIPAGKIFLVQLSDFALDSMSEVDDLVDVARHSRVFPGEGAHGRSIADLVKKVRATGYRGDYALGARSDTSLAGGLAETLARARKSTAWLEREISGQP